MVRRHQELWFALVAIVATTAIYALAYRQASTFPSASGLVGHGIGIVGFILMLMTATLYSIRKRLTDAHWGNMAAWLKFHMFTGLVGPYMVLLHTAMRFHGLAGVAMLLTVIVVMSGLVGRYIYTRVPRVIEGAEPAVSGLERRFAPTGSPVMAPAAAGTTSAMLEASLVAPLEPSSPRSDEPRGAQAAPAGGRSPDKRFAGLAARRKRLATWRALHIPLTWALFVTAIVHAVGALYYAVR